MKAMTMLEVGEIRTRGLGQQVQDLVLKLSDYLQLVKFKLSALVIITVGLGYLLALRNHWSVVLSHFALTLLGTFLVAGAANAFNQILERDVDALMNRTRNRPLPSGRMSLLEGFIAALLMAFSGLTILVLVANWKAAAMAAAALTIYVFAYTPLKRRSEFCTIVGAISGAIPPMIGWVAVRNEVGLEALVLFAIQFLWQFPHFWAIAWLYRNDYQLAGFQILPMRGEPNSVTRQTVHYTIATVLVSAYPILMVQEKAVFALGVFLLGAWFISAALKFHRFKSQKSAKVLLSVADAYLPLVLMLWILAKRLGV